jgi:hypothetical protein
VGVRETATSEESLGGVVVSHAVNDLFDIGRPLSAIYRFVMPHNICISREPLWLAVVWSSDRQFSMATESEISGTYQSDVSPGGHGIPGLQGLRLVFVIVDIHISTLGDRFRHNGKSPSCQ